MAGRARSPLLPDALRQEVIEAASGYTLAEIAKLFRSEGYSLPSDFEPTQGAMRRSTAEALDRSIDFTSSDEVEAYLRVVERLLDELADTALRTNLQWAAGRITRIQRELRRADVRVGPNGRITFNKRLVFSDTLANAPTESGIRLAIKGLERSEAEPEEKIGAAKELVEATIKHALDELGEPFDAHHDIPALSKQLHKRLRLDPKGIAPTTRGAEAIIRILGGLTQVPQGLAELRNEGYGTGHGQSKRISGIKVRHAELAARSAGAYAAFILDTLADPDAPWR